MNTVLSEIKHWNTKYLRKLENHTNALTVNLLDNSETTRRLKRYTVLTQTDRLEKTPMQELKCCLSEQEKSIWVTPQAYTYWTYTFILDSADYL
jgi:hypothetical protein